MNYRKLLSLILLVASLFTADVNAQARPRPTRPRSTRTPTTKPTARAGNTAKVEFDLLYDFSLQAIPSKLTFVAIVPQTIPGRQEILDTKYSTEPARIFKQHGNTYAQFVFDKPQEQFQLKISIEAKLSRYDLATAKKAESDFAKATPDRKAPPQEPNLADFLKQEPYIEKDDPQIKQIAETINAPTEIETARKIYDFVTDRLTYVVRTEEYGAVKTLREKRGGCTEYADLFVALCRAKNIPARVVKGYATEYVSIPQHAWAEAYLKDYGWVPFDLIYGDVDEEHIREKRFEKLKPIYIYLTHTRNDPILAQAITVEGFLVGDVQLQDSIVFK
jgi:transglutaminase-like putative cysteine protease